MSVSRRGKLTRRRLLTAVGAVGLGASANVRSADVRSANVSSGEQSHTALTLADLVADKGPLRLLNDRPINAETPAHLLDDETTPTRLLFVRNNGHLPTSMDAGNWRLEIAGESCVRAQSFSIQELKSLFKSYTYDLQLECGGNGRAEFRPRAGGNQWTTGAVGCPRWRGVRVKDVLSYCGVTEDAVYLAFEGADLHLSGDPDKLVISRGVPMHKALQDESLIAYELNGEPIPPLHGAPLRLVCGGWPGSVSGKWLTRLLVRNQVHDEPKMGGQSYRVPCEPVAPGANVPDDQMCIIESMPIKSLVTFPRSGISVAAGAPLTVRGHAWAGDNKVVNVEISTNYGVTWRNAELAEPVNRLAWQHWQAVFTPDKTGYFEVWAKATDDVGRSQPTLLPGWNPKGYLNNDAAHRIAIHVS